MKVGIDAGGTLIKSSKNLNKDVRMKQNLHKHFRGNCMVKRKHF